VKIGDTLADLLSSDTSGEVKVRRRQEKVAMGLSPYPTLTG